MTYYDSTGLQALPDSVVMDKVNFLSVEQPRECRAALENMKERIPWSCAHLQQKN